MEFNLEKQNDECGVHDKGGACAVPDTPRLIAAAYISDQIPSLDPRFGPRMDHLNHC